MNRRQFLKHTGAAALGLGLAGFGARRLRAADLAASPSNRLRIAVIGTNSRGLFHVECLAGMPGVEVAAICDVDERAIRKGVEVAAKRQTVVPAGIRDFRRVLEDPLIDAVTIATPDHWHAPMAILALAAGKHVYVEKPCSHNPQEGEWLIEAQRKSGKLVQMGNQRRSFPQLQQAIADIHNGLIGRAYLGRAWYVNHRTSIGHGHPAPVPGWLDYELWQGPAPRRPYVDNRIHYNWHWFWHWGTGEALNNGTHEVDVCRWALGADFPTRVTSSGGRYAFDDDWETPDTQVIGLDFEGRKSISWEGRSCNDYPEENLGRGSMIYGTEGSALLDGDSCTIYDAKNKVIRSQKATVASDSANTLSSTGLELDRLHFVNFVDAIRRGTRLNSPIAEGYRSVVSLQLGNIAWRVGRTLHCDPASGHVLDDPEAARLWRRDYEPGWEPKV